MIFSKAAISTGRSSSSGALVSPVQAQLSRSRGNDGRTRDFSGPYDDNALDPALCFGIRKALKGHRFACRAGASWRVDETYVKIKGHWTYLYRADDKQGKTLDFLLRAKRDVASAKAFFRRAFKNQGRPPRAITLDGHQASHRAAREILGQHRRGKRTKIRVLEVLK